MNQRRRPTFLLLGKNGQIGWELQRTLAPLGNVVAFGREELDLTDASQMVAQVRVIRPDILVNAAAYTDVERAEEESELAMTVNGIAPGILAEEAQRLGAGLVHYSTDYVFDGSKCIPYTEEDEPHPLNVYGHTKLAGERAIQEVGGASLILRTSWVYGLRGRNFLLTLLRLAREREELRVVQDQVGSPTWSRMVAEATALILAQGMADLNEFLLEQGGLYHLSGTGEASRHAFAQAILAMDPGAEEQVIKRIIPIGADEYPSRARRPGYSVLDTYLVRERWGIQLPPWPRSLTQLWS